jgi:hypothetical protein
MDAKFPIGPFLLQQQYTTGELQLLIAAIENAPEAYRNLVDGLSETDLLKTYRDGSWNIRQLMHHVADIAFLHYFRMKKALTEPGSEMAVILMDSWAQTSDSLEGGIEDSLLMFRGVISRYALLARTLTEDQLNITYFHPVRQISLNQKQALAMSAWHVQHHLAHIQLALGKGE